MRMLSIDIETYSSISIKDSGVYAYASSPDFEILMAAYAFDDEEVKIVDLALSKLLIEGLIAKGLTPEQARWEALPKDLREGLVDKDIVKAAYNANFERTCLTSYLGLEMPPEQWKCTAVHASTLGLPGSLDKVGEVLKLGEDKQKLKTGKALIQYFSIPCKATKKNGGRTRNLPEHDMEKWDLFKEYCIQDVVTERAIRKKIERFKIIDSEQELWCLDQKMNDRGIRIDMDLVNTIIDYDEGYQKSLLKEAEQLTGLSNPKSVAQLKKWLSDKGVEVDSLNKESVGKLLKELEDPTVKRVLELRQEMSKTSTKKYEAMKRAVCPDGNIRGVLQFYGANRTGRWAGRLVQVHNLPQNKIPDIELAREVVKNKEFDMLELLFQGAPFVLSQLVRTAFVASPGNRFIISDFSAIEARVIAWLSGEQWRLDVFSTHGKIYEASASQMFKVPLSSIGKGSPLRQKGKIAELALGYGGGYGALVTMGALDMGLSEDELPGLVSSWRQANPAITKFWYMCEAAAKTAIKERRPVKIQHNLVFSFESGILFIQLPGGRRLAYFNAKVQDIKGKGKESITYEGLDQTTKAWTTLETYGGKLVENIVQATARDCLAVAMMRLDKAGYDIAMHVHDEAILDVPCNQQDMDKITDIMGQDIEWAKGLPLKGDTYETPFYKKD